MKPLQTIRTKVPGQTPLESGNNPKPVQAAIPCDFINNPALRPQASSITWSYRARFAFLDYLYDPSVETLSKVLAN
jgi:hypothetical protein